MFGITDLYEMQVFVIIRADMQNVTNNIYSIAANKISKGVLVVKKFLFEILNYLVFHSK
jgi:hypothetical protein